MTRNEILQLFIDDVHSRSTVNNSIFNILILLDAVLRGSKRVLMATGEIKLLIKKTFNQLTPK